MRPLATLLLPLVLFGGGAAAATGCPTSAEGMSAPAEASPADWVYTDGADMPSADVGQPVAAAAPPPKRTRGRSRVASGRIGHSPGAGGPMLCPGPRGRQAARPGLVLPASPRGQAPSASSSFLAISS